jgi:recombination protein RecR
MNYPKLIENLIEQLMKLPGVGRRSAERIVFWLLNNPQDQSEMIAKSITQLKEGLRLCRECNNLSEAEICLVCSDPRRDKTIICVVEDHKHLLAIERTGTYQGLYYVLLGAISPADGRGPEDLKISRLVQKVKAGDVKEVVIATDPDTEGEMTAIHITKELRPTAVKISRIGLGIPVGSSVEYADLSTLSISLTSRREILEEGKVST